LQRGAIRWEDLSVRQAFLERHQGLNRKSIAKVAQEQGKDPLDAFLDLALEEDLNTSFSNDQGRNGDDWQRAAILQSPNVLIGLSDAGAHVQFQAGYGYGTTVLGHWVREQQALSLEEGDQEAYVHAGVDLRHCEPRSPVAWFRGGHRGP
jgi:N-acyl-D-aspartate/D-glutamate deacylase